MTLKRLPVFVRCLSLAAVIAGGALLLAQQPPAPTDPAQSSSAKPAQDGIEVLARGPIHEAYAEPVTAQPQASPVVPKQPPDPIEEMPPEQRPAGDNVRWIPGYWSWDEDRTDFIWVSGIWRIAPPEKQWVPGHWSQVSGGWQWSPGYWAAGQQGEIQYLPAPPEPLEAAASEPAPSEDSVYVPGNWMYNDNRYAWRAGYWVNYRPGWLWVPAHYIWTPAGSVFVEGYWDFELERRGLLFAPVYFQRPLWRTAGWFYQPNYIVYDDFLWGALFVRQGFNNYFFGDYFDPVYANRGFTSWIDFRFGSHGYDPLFSYYRWSNRGNPQWSGNLRTLYAGRARGDIARPPHNLNQQATVVQNSSTANARQVTALAPLTNVNRTVVNLQPVAQAERTQHQQTAQQLHDVGRQRRDQETQIHSKGSASAQPNAPPRALKLDLPKTSNAPGVAAPHQPPPHPLQERRPPREPGAETAPPGQQPAIQPGTARPPGQPVTQPRAEPQQPRVEPRPTPRPEPKPTPHPPPSKPPGKPPHEGKGPGGG